MALKVYDVHGNERDLPWLRSKYGDIVVRSADPAPFGGKFALQEIREQRDLVSIFVTVLDENGAPKASQPVANRWPDESLTDLTVDPSLKSVYFPRADVKYSNNMGVVEWNFGPGSVIKTGDDGLDRGPHSLWVLSSTYPSDGVFNVGWLGGTNHWGPLVFKFAIVKGKEPSGCLMAAKEIWNIALEWLSSLFGR